MTPGKQRALLRVALHRLDARLLRMSSGAGWRKYLLLESLGSGLWTNTHAQPNAKTRAALQRVAARFETVAKNPKFKKIADLWGFQATRAALGEYAIEPVDRSKRQVRSNVTTLVESLDRVRTGGSWKKYFRTADINRIAQSKTKLAAADRDILRQIVKRLKEVSKKPEFEKVAKAKGFDATRKALESLEHEALKLDSSVARGRSADGKKVLVSMADILKDLRKASRYNRDAHQACAAMSSKTVADDSNGKLYLAAKEHLKQANDDANDRMKRLTGLIKNVLAENAKKQRNAEGGTTVTLMQFRDVEEENEPVTVTLMQFKDVEEEVEHVLMQFEDVDGQGEKEEYSLIRLADGIQPRNRSSLAMTIAKLEAAPDAFGGLDEKQSRQVADIVAKIKAAKHDEANATWKQFVAAAKAAKLRDDLSARVQSITSAAYLEDLEDLKQRKDKADFYNGIAEELHEHIAKLKRTHRGLGKDASVTMDTIDDVPRFRAGRHPCAKWKKETMSREEVTEKIADLGEKAEEVRRKRRLANIDLEGAKQKQEEIMKMMSRVSKMLHDSAKAAARKAG